MINSLLDSAVMSTLEKNGWYEGRKIDISGWITQLTKEGFKCPSYAVEILEELGGLRVKPERVKRGESFPGDIDFQALNAGSGEYDRMEIFEPIAQENLFPLGMVFSQWFLYVGFSKRIYMGNMNELYLIGNNIEDSLNTILLGLKNPTALHR